jgi:diphthine synthase
MVRIGGATLGELVFVGLGLGDRGISLAGVDAIKASDMTYLETYTSPPSPTLLIDLETATGKRVLIVRREFVEDGKEILEKARASRVVLAVQGDPMIATTHTDLRVRAASRGIRTSVVHGATIPAAAASGSGLHYYKFGGTITFTLKSASHHQDVYKRIHRNLLEGQHTLLLLEHDVEKDQGVDPGFVFERLLEAENNFKRGVLSERTMAIVLGRVGMEGEAAFGGRFGTLRGRSFGPPPHCVIIPGRLHFTEEEALAAIIGLDKDDIVDNSLAVKRTAQVLVPRYVEKARKALAEARETLKGRHPELLENAELYLKDSESFLANNEDELAMLSVGYAEGLVDALSFTGEVKLSW